MGAGWAVRGSRGAWRGRARRGADLREGAVEEGPLGDDKVGAEAAGDGLLRGTQLLLRELQAAVELVQVTPATEDAQQGHRLAGTPSSHRGLCGRAPFLWPSSLPQERKRQTVYPQGWTCRGGAGVRGQETGSQQRCLQGSDWGGGVGTRDPAVWQMGFCPSPTPRGSPPGAVRPSSEPPCPAGEDLTCHSPPARMRRCLLPAGRPPRPRAHWASTLPCTLGPATEKHQTSKKALWPEKMALEETGDNLEPEECLK